MHRSGVTQCLASLCLLVLLPMAAAANPAPGEVRLYFFWNAGCPHCAGEREYLRRLPERFPWVVILDFEIGTDPANARLLDDVTARLGAGFPGLPYTVVCDRGIFGWYDAQVTGARIEEALRGGRGFCRDVAGEALGLSPLRPADGDGTAPPRPGGVRVPFLGEVTPGSVSLPVLTILLAAVDGFNPCAMWVLVFLIGLLLGTRDRSRMWLLGGVFLLTSAAFYFLVLAAWLNILLVLGFVRWIRGAIGLVAVAGGVHSLRRFAVAPPGACPVGAGERRQRVLARLKALTVDGRLLLAMAGIALLAVSVNLVELVCSAGLPVAFTQVLALSRLPAWAHYGYLALYVLVFLLDDLIVFVGAMLTLRLTGLSEQYSRYSNLVGGLVLLGIGGLLLFKPEWLMLG